MDDHERILARADATLEARALLDQLCCAYNLGQAPQHIVDAAITAGLAGGPDAITEMVAAWHAELRDRPRRPRSWGHGKIGSD